MNAMMADIPGKIFNAPQCEHFTLQTVSVWASASIAASTSPMGSGLNYTATLIANDIRLVFAWADHQAAAVVHIRDIFMGNDRQIVEGRVHADILPRCV